MQSPTTLRGKLAMLKFKPTRERLNEFYDALVAEIERLDGQIKPQDPSPETEPVPAQAGHKE